MRTLKFWLMLIVLVVALTNTQPSFAEGSGPRSAPIYGADSPDAISGEYIVVFKAGTAGEGVGRTIEQARGNGASVHFVYTTALTGFAASLPEQALNGLVHNPNVEYIEVDQTVTIDGTQTPATWGLDRIDQHSLPLNNTYTYNSTGAGVNAYIIDTGIQVSHNEFGGRASVSFDSVGDGRNGVDCNGHGTHVAGTVGGTTYGVAKNVSLYAVRVLNCSGSGTTSGVIAGVDWVAGNHASPAVANMSLGGGASTALDTAVNNSINAGVTYAVAAGNSKRDACKYSPARVPAALTVGATTSSDARASYSNYGPCLDLFAPGSSITSAWIGSVSATNTISGTSMATPHVAGVAALYLSANPNAAPSTVAAAIKGAATPNVVSNAGRGSVNLLLYSLVP
ncbi:MAG: S8 family peptidase [Bellilinea sp.]